MSRFVRQPMIEIRWADEAGWQAVKAFDTSKSVGAQLDAARAELAADNARYGMALRAEFRVGSPLVDRFA
jgi:hypothetical protein